MAGKNDLVEWLEALQALGGARRIADLCKPMHEGFYTGFTEHLENRLIHHNNGTYQIKIWLE